nr:protein translocase subunit SecD [Maliibacterium massiliense]
MKKRSIFKFTLMVLIIALLSYVAVAGFPFGIYNFKPLHENIKQGLDLQGGLSILYQAKPPEDGSDFDSGVVGTIAKQRARLDQQGYTEATITRQGGDRIRIEIPDVHDPQQVIDILGTPAKLTFVDPDGTVIIDGSHVKRAQATLDDAQKPVIAFELNNEGATKFAEATQRLIGQKITIKLDDEELSSPTVNSVIAGGQGVIENMESTEKAEELAELIMSGALPLELEQLEVRSISATLGESALRMSIIAGLIGLALLMVFMLVYYRLPGLTACIALAGYMVIMLFMLATIPGVQLTLPGIAGIILSIGMAVDANVIIFERFKDELRTGKPPKTALRMGFSKAFSSILDSNITTVIAALVLMFFGTGPIKGFAITLLIGILVSMFSALVLTRSLLKWTLDFGVRKKGAYMFAPDKQKKLERIGVTKHYKKVWVFSGIVLLAGVVMFFVGGFNWGIDFTGGTIMTVSFEQEYKEADLSDALQKAGFSNVQVNKSAAEVGGEKTLATVRVKEIIPEEQQADMRGQIETTLKDTYHYENVKIDDFETVGATVGGELTRNAVIAVLIASALILCYIWIRFELASGIAAVIALVHDVAIMAAVCCVVRLTLNSSFIAAILTIVGYSINNTIIIFDRIRENKRRSDLARMSNARLADLSVNETLTRTINTSLTTLVMILGLYILGVDSIKEFSLPIIVGLVAGTYSSMFVAPVLWSKLASRLEKGNSKPGAAQKKAKRAGAAGK